MPKMVALKDALSALFHPIPQAEWEKEAECGAHPNEEIYHTLVNVAAIRASVGKFGTEVTLTQQMVETGIADVVAKSVDGLGAFILEMKCG